MGCRANGAQAPIVLLGTTASEPFCATPPAVPGLAEGPGVTDNLKRFPHLAIVTFGTPCTIGQANFCACVREDDPAQRIRATQVWGFAEDMPDTPVQDTAAQKKSAERLATSEEVRSLHSKPVTPEPEIEAAIAQLLNPPRPTASNSKPADAKKEPERAPDSLFGAEASAQSAREFSPQRPDMLELAAILDQHKIWAESGGESGAKADLCGADLSNADLTGANLQGAFLQKAKLRGADLSMANLRGASLVQADLRDTNLLGTELRGANLMGASLYGADGLWVGRLGGTNLFDAMLPESISSFDGAGAVAEVTRSARWFYFLMLTITVLCIATVGFTTDVRLILDGPAIPIPRYGRILPAGGFYLGAPILLLILYARFHFLLLRLWGSMAALPAVFREGQTLDREGPWYLMGLVRRHLRWVADSRAPQQKLESAVANALAYWSVPAALFLIWLRYLVCQDMRGTLLHILIFSLVVAAATSLPATVSRIIRPGELRKPSNKSFWRVALWSLRAALWGAVVLLLLSFGVIHGLPVDPSIAPQISAASPLRWAANVIRVTGLRPYADLTEATLVTSATRRSPNEDTAGQTVGAGLNQMELRYARAYRATLTSARLWRGNLVGAYLTEADLRGANLREAKLQDAVLDHTRASGAILISADGRGADLTGADLEKADLTYSVFEGAQFANAKLSGASLYGANLRGTKWLRAQLTRADVRDAQMQGAQLGLANLELSDFSGAKLGAAQFGGADLKGTIFLGADLRNTDLRGAAFDATVLRDAAMSGANIEGTDLRGTLGLTAGQVCSTTGWRTATFDSDVAAEVAKSCGASRP